MTDAKVAIALAHREKAFEKRTKYVCITKLDEQLALAKLRGELSQQRAAGGRRQRRGAAPVGRPVAQPVAQPLGGPAKELPESVMDQLEVGYIKTESGELQPVLLRWETHKGERVQRR